MITLTSTAVEKLKQNIDQRGYGIGVKIGVKTTGCSGMAYVMDYVDELPLVDYTCVYDQNNLQMWVSDKHFDILENLAIDWQRQGINEGFTFNNPKESARCGCGESFTV